MQSCRVPRHVRGGRAAPHLGGAVFWALFLVGRQPPICPWKGLFLDRKWPQVGEGQPPRDHFRSPEEAKATSSCSHPPPPLPGFSANSSPYSPQEVT